MKKVVAAAREFQVPIIGENSDSTYDKTTFKQIITTTKLYMADLQKSFSLNPAVDERFGYTWDKFMTFYHFVESMSQFRD